MRYLPLSVSHDQNSNMVISTWDIHITVGSSSVTIIWSGLNDNILTGEWLQLKTSFINKSYYIKTKH